MKRPEVTVISLVKNDFIALKNTAFSITNQKKYFVIEWIIIDGSDKKLIREDQNLINALINKKIENLIISFKDMNEYKIEGIYPCMNFGLRKSSGKSIIFLNCGDTFFNDNSLFNMYLELRKLNNEKSFIFGQANIIYSKDLFWKFPGKRIKRIKQWLKKFEPNHQSMLITRKLANLVEFDETCKVISDGIWKREIINNAESIFYINKPVINFNLDGISNKKPKLNDAISQLKSKKITFFRKLLILVKLIIPKKLYFLYPYFQKYKSSVIDYIFEFILI